MIGNNSRRTFYLTLKDSTHQTILKGRTSDADFSPIPMLTYGEILHFVYLLYIPTSGIAITLKTGRREVPGANPGRACRPSRSVFFGVFSETSVKTG